MTRTLLFPGGFSLFVEQEFGARRRGPSSRFCRSPAPVAEATAADETIQQMVGRIRSCPDPGDASTVLYDGAMTAKHHEKLLKQGLLLMNRPPAKKRTTPGSAPPKTSATSAGITTAPAEAPGPSAPATG